MNGDSPTGHLDDLNDVHDARLASAPDSDKGTVRRFTASSPGPPAHAAKGHRPPSPFVSNTDPPPFRTLIVVHNTTTQLLLHTLLDEHCDVTMVPTAQQAFEALRSQRNAEVYNGAAETQRCAFDMIMVDLGLEDSCSGAELLVQLRGMEALHNTPVVALTAHACSRTCPQLLDNEFDSPLGKPFTPSELFSIVLQMTD